ncbi:segregation/condensation protein A [Candidatus Kaiserbacteria bacterium]|nr:MAG: segregation/condensation protein A [Candidatus Kaiserbacteria bacterium]
MASVFTLEVGEFKGPLELLLDLIERRKLEVSDISLSTVADEYVEYIEDRSHIPLSETAQFVVIASTLLLIKSRALLPSLALTTDEEEDIRDLEHRLKLYAHARHAAKLLRAHWGKSAYLPKNPQKSEVIFAPANDITESNILLALKKVMEAIPTFTKAPIAQIAREIRLEDIIDSLTTRMQSAFTDSFKNLTSKADRVESIVHFLALLELVKRGTLGAQQQGNFSDITMNHEDVDTPHYG